MPEKIEDVIKRGNFRVVYDLYQSTLGHLWNPGMGTGVRGEFVVLTMSTLYYTENDVNLFMARVGGKRLQPATAYELASFALPDMHRWDGQTTVVAFGSKAGRGAVPRLDATEQGKRRLLMEGPSEGGMWRNNRSILCVRV